MGNRTLRGILVLGLAAMVLAGCSSDKNDSDNMSAAPETMEADSMDTGSNAAPAAAAEAIRPRITSDRKISIPSGMGSADDMEVLQGIFYFDFDQAIVKRAGHVELNKHADVLSENPSFRIRLEGHGDERGTREYNLALGERRAMAISAYLVAQGVSRSQIEVISYGEEKPVDGGHGEAAWAKNRRVEIVYR